MRLVPFSSISCEPRADHFDAHVCVCVGTRALVGEERHLPTHGTIVYVPLIDLNKQMGSVEFAFGTVSPNTDIAAEKDPLSEAAKS